ncbi:MAG: tetratricopeptide repeat protein [Elusimicrobia bacterium]|nr:tetratricopeptide repeat protein [Elusimicrobiota bacterium]
MGNCQIDALMDSGKKLLQAGDAEEALRIFMTLRGIAPEHGACIFEIGKILYLKKDYENAKNFFIEAIAIDDKIVYAHILLGKIYEIQSEYRKAITSFTKAVVLDGNAPELHYEIGKAYIKLNDFEKGRVEAIREIEISGSVLGHVLLGLVECGENRIEDAKIAFKKALQIDSKCSIAYFELAKIYIQSQDFVSAREMIAAGMHCGDNQSFACMLLGDIEMAQGNYAEALAVFSSATNMEGFPGEIQLKIAECYLHMGLGDRAKLLLLSLKSRFSGQALYNILLGRIYVAENLHEKALLSFRAAQAIDPESVELNKEIGNLLLMQSEFAQEMDTVTPQSDESVEVVYTLQQLAEGFGINAMSKYDSPINIISLMNDSTTIHDNIGHLLHFIRYCNDVGGHDSALSVISRIKQTHCALSDCISNQLDCERNIGERRSDISTLPISIDVHITTKCNLRCVMCSLDKKTGVELSPYVKEQILAIMPYLHNISWLGGEVFLYDGFEELFVAAGKYGIKQKVTTNGLLIDDRIARKLIENNVELEISIDGATKDIYESIRRGARFEDMLNSINIIKHARKSLSSKYGLNMAVVIMKSNYHQIIDFVEFAKKHEFDAIQFKYIICGIDHPENILTCDYNERKRIVDMLDKAKLLCQCSGIEYFTNITGEYILGSSSVDMGDAQRVTEDILPQQFVEINATEPKLINPQRNTCFAPWRKAVVRFDGSVLTGAHCDCGNIVGNLNNSSFEIIWNGEIIQRYRELLLSGRIDKICSLVKLYNRVPYEILNPI